MAIAAIADKVPVRPMIGYPRIKTRTINAKRPDSARTVT
jgi:hypothetical protein